MAVIIVFIAAFIGLAVVARIGLSSSVRERRSMSGHRQTLETISKVTDTPLADRDVRAFKVEPMRPVRLDLSKLDDLTDPDLIRITAPVSDNDAPRAAQPSKSEPVDVGDSMDAPATPEAVPAPKVVEEVRADAETVEVPAEPESSEALSSSGQSNAATAFVIGEDGVVDGDLTAQLPGVQSQPTQTMPVFEDSGVDEQDFAPRHPEVGQHRVYSTGRRSLPLSAMVVGAGAIAVVLGVGFFALGSNSSSTSPPLITATKRSHSSPTSTKSGSSSKKTAAVKSSQKSSGKSTGGGGGSSPSSAATPTSFSPVSANSSYATFDIPGGARTIVVSASQPCWVADSDSANGPLLWDETLPAGGSYTISSNASSLWIKVGNAHEFHMQVNGLPVSFSSPPGVFAFDLVATSG